MASVGVCNLEGEKIGSIDLPEAVFGIEPSVDAIYYAIKAYLHNQSQGNASTKTRAQVDRSKRKMYRQKGTGRARKGTAGSPILVGGGIAHGPKPRDFYQRVPQKVKQLALRSAFSATVRARGFLVTCTAITTASAARGSEASPNCRSRQPV